MIVPPPTPKSALNVPASVAMTARRARRADTGAILGGVSVPTVETIGEALRPFTEEPARAAIFCDVDGTLADIVERAENAHVPESTSRLLGVIGRRYGCVAGISGRSATEARRLVGV